ncbi:unnamed protein product [Brassica oleracea var. botrytis]
MANPPFPSAILTTADQNPLTTKRYFLILKLRIFTYHELSAATNGGNFLGKGSQGRVYKAFLDGGRHRGMVNLISVTALTKLLVVEYMPNGTLHGHLHSRSSLDPHSWNRRIKQLLLKVSNWFASCQIVLFF